MVVYSEHKKSDHYVYIIYTYYLNIEMRLCILSASHPDERAENRPVIVAHSSMNMAKRVKARVIKQRMNISLGSGGAGL